jgi:hypothetical protein
MMILIQKDAIPLFNCIKMQYLAFFCIVYLWYSMNDGVSDYIK